MATERERDVSRYGATRIEFHRIDIIEIGISKKKRVYVPGVDPVLFK